MTVRQLNPMERYLIITVAISGSGKTYWRRSITDKFPMQVICPDDIRLQVCGDISDQSKNWLVWKIAYENLEKWVKSVSLINTTDNLIFDSTCCNLKTLKEILKKIGGTPVVAIFKILPADIELSFSRISNDIENGIVRSNVPKEVLERQYDGYKSVVEFIKNNNYQVLEDDSN